MITLITILCLWGIYSIYRWKKLGWDMPTLEIWMGGIIGGVALIAVVIFLITKYLP